MRGTYYTTVPQVGGIQSRIDLGLRPEWGNTAEKTVCMYLKPGTVIYVGNVASQSGASNANSANSSPNTLWVGGTIQIFVPRGQ